MRRIVRSAETWTYVPLSDRDLSIEQQTTFTLRPLTLAERSHLRDSLTRTLVSEDGAVAIVNRTREVGIEVVLNQIERIENFPPGTPAAWPKSRDDRIAYLEMMSDADVKELADEIFSHSTLGAPEKNFSPPGRISSSPDALAAPASTTAASASAIPH